MIRRTRVTHLLAIVALTCVAASCTQQRMTHEEFRAMTEKGWARSGIRLTEAQREQALATAWENYLLAMSGDTAALNQNMDKMRAEAREAVRQETARQYARRSIADIEREYVESVRSHGDAEHRAFLLDQLAEKLPLAAEAVERARLYKKYQRPVGRTSFPAEIDGFYDRKLYEDSEIMSLRLRLLMSAPATADKRLIPLLIPYLEDPTSVSVFRRPIKDAAHAALVRLSGEDLGTDAAAWASKYGRE